MKENRGGPISQEVLWSIDDADQPKGEERKREEDGRFCYASKTPDFLEGDI